MGIIIVVEMPFILNQGAGAKGNNFLVMNNGDLMSLWYNSCGRWLIDWLMDECIVWLVDCLTDWVVRRSWLRRFIYDIPHQFGISFEKETLDQFTMNLKLKI